MENEKKINVSSEADISIAFNEGRAEITGTYDGKLGGAKVTLYTDAAKLVDQITDLIPGEWDDALLDDLAKRVLSKKTGE